MVQATAVDGAGREKAAAAAAKELATGMVLGLGTGRTAEAFLVHVAARIAEGLDLIGVPTSRRTAGAAQRLGIPLSDLDAHPTIDLTVDGADEIDPRLRLIKGGGGALVREKIIAAASREMLVVADRSKYVAELGAFPLPIEIVPFGAAATIGHIERVASLLGLAGGLDMRAAGERFFVTDNGNHIVDASFGGISDPERLAIELAQIPGVVEHGLFVNLATRAIIADADGVEWLEN